MIVIVYLGELASNTAVAAIFLPVAGALAIGMDTAALTLMLPTGLSKNRYPASNFRPASKARNSAGPTKAPRMVRPTAKSGS